MSLPCDWQISKQKLMDRSQSLLQSGQWSDCKFIVGQEPHQQIIKGHKLFLAMSSPVFEAMFFGPMAEKNDPIPIRDVQPEAFKVLLEYIYTDRVDFNSFELACELCYCAKKYMLPSLVEECTKYLWSDVSPKKACRAYEFAKLFEEPVLMEKCLQIICTKTNEVLKEPNWEEVELGTLLTVLEQDHLHISSEMELFTAVERWAKAECTRKLLDPSDGKSLKSVIGNALSKVRFLSLSPQEFAEGPGMSSLLTQDESFAILMNMLCTGNKAPMPEGFSTNSHSRTKLLKAPTTCIDYLSHRQLNPRFNDLTLPSSCGIPPSLCYDPNFINNAESSGTLQNTSPILIESEVRNHTENLNVNNTVYPIVAIERGIQQEEKHYCLRSVHRIVECLNTNVLDCSLTFSVDKNIRVLGVQVPAQVARVAVKLNRLHNPNTSYTEILYAHLLDYNDTRLTYTHFTTKVNINTLVDITFNQPVYIQKNKVYRVGVVFNKVGRYPVAVCSRTMTCDSVCFSFGVDDEEDDVRDGLIRSIVFTYHDVNM